MTTSATVPFLLTGVTGGLGAKILHGLLHKHHIPANDIIATSRSESNRARFEMQGLRFRVADYSRPETLTTAFAGVEQLLFMSSSQIDTTRRNTEHANVVAAAQQVGVRKVWYVSLAFGGFGDGSKVFFQQAHYKTEDDLVASGLDFVALRAGVYADAFPLFLNWYPSSKKVRLPKFTPPLEESKVAWTSREELGEGIATLLARGLAAFPAIQPRTKKNIVLLTSHRATSLTSIIEAIDNARSATTTIEYLEPEQWVAAQVQDDEGGKGEGWYRAMLSLNNDLVAGDAETVDPALGLLLGREPETGGQTVERLLRENQNYTWHQNYSRGN